MKNSADAVEGGFRFLRGEREDRSVIDLIRENSFGDNTAVVDGDVRLSYNTFWDRVDRLSNGLIALGLQRGAVLMAWLPNGHEAMEAEMAALQIGAIWVSINSRFTWHEVEEIINDCQPRCFITDPEHLKRMPMDPSLRDRIPASIPHMLLCQWGAPRIRRMDAYERMIADSPLGRPNVSINIREIARLRYTSGTTGKAKAAILTHRVYVASLRNLQQQLHPLTADDSVLHAAPLTHASGALMFPILAAGGVNVIMPDFDVAELLETIERERISTIFVVPTILQRMAAADGLDTINLSTLKDIVYGGAPTPIQKLGLAIEKFGPVLLHIYGMTEAPYPICALGHDAHQPGHPKLGSIGRPTSVCELEIRDEAGHHVAPGEAGEIWLRGDNLMSGYWNDAVESAHAIHDGWLATGDLGHCDADGYYWIVDRKKDVIISGGFNVYAREVESVIGAHPDVLEVAVLGVPHEEWGETVAAFVVLRNGAWIGPDELNAWCRNQLSAYKCPRILKFLNELPKNSAGKIQKRALRDRADLD